MSEFITSLQQRCAKIATLSCDRQQFTQASKLIEDTVQHSDWLLPEHLTVDDSQGWSLHPIFTKADHTFGLFVTAWSPHRGAPPHTHGGWTVVGGLRGVELNIDWRRVDDATVDGVAEIEKIGEVRITPGQVYTMQDDAHIHSVVNPMDQVSVTLHAYQYHPNYVDRWLFDPVTKTVQPFITIPIDDK
jgi:predicted metal-dependent enzyme (double-stranded beta helix superfamily)